MKYELVKINELETVAQAFGKVNNNFVLIDEFPKDIYIDLDSNNWDNSEPNIFKKTLLVSGVTENSQLTISISDNITKEQRQEAIRAELHATNQGDGFIIITAFRNIPNITIPLLIRIER